MKSWERLTLPPRRSCLYIDGDDAHSSMTNACCWQVSRYTSTADSMSTLLEVGLLHCIHIIVIICVSVVNLIVVVTLITHQ